GVLYMESVEDLRFGYDEEDALAALASHLGTMICLLQGAAEDAADTQAPTPPGVAPRHGAPLLVRHFASNDSIFLDEDYLIKGVAGAIFWT
ncbi:hypothetical protein, partial [Escherichia coli]|uniref:hypothetical protein n=1 Tax=Escherichia coli TaxID=562 RepID=UPI000CC3D5E5